MGCTNSTISVSGFHSAEHTSFCDSQSQSRAALLPCSGARMRACLATGPTARDCASRLAIEIGWVAERESLCFPRPPHSWLYSRKARKTFVAYVGVPERVVLAAQLELQARLGSVEKRREYCYHLMQLHYFSTDSASCSAGSFACCTARCT